jgi:hypothetical protein
LATQAEADDHRPNHHVQFHRATSPHEVRNHARPRIPFSARQIHTPRANRWKEPGEDDRRPFGTRRPTILVHSRGVSI